MPRTKTTLHVLTLFVAGALGADALVGCVAENEPGPSLNPQPLPPSAPPADDDQKNGETQEPPAGEPADGLGTGAASSGSSGTSGSSGSPPDAGGN